MELLRKRLLLLQVLLELPVLPSVPELLLVLLPEPVLPVLLLPVQMLRQLLLLQLHMLHHLR